MVAYTAFHVLLYRIFDMVVDRLYLPEVQKVSGLTSRKICALGMTKLLTEAAAMLPGGAYHARW